MWRREEVILVRVCQMSLEISAGKVVSVNVGRPRTFTVRDEIIVTSIFKDPVRGRVRISTLNIEGDEQSDLSVHGGVNKAVYAYPSEHYASWRRELPEAALAWGAFGENLTIEGLLEETTCIGDRLRIGTAELVVTQPRTPCYKLAYKFGRPDIIKRFQKSGRSGFYLSVAKEGDVGAGDAIDLLSRAEGALTVTDALK
jgi:MOSC domain-containing protein YiiM